MEGGEKKLNLPLDKVSDMGYDAGMKPTNDIEEQLRQAILGAGMSRFRLARLSGVAEAVLSRFVNRKRGVTMETGARLARVLGLTLKRGSRPKAKAEGRAGRSRPRGRTKRKGG
jgi:transcriptional regulator with XRE-family HTH domain